MNLALLGLIASQASQTLIRMAHTDSATTWWSLQVASSRMSYSRFLEYLDMGRVKKVSSSQSAQKCL